MTYRLLTLVALLFVAFPAPAQAVLPPEVIMSVGAQAAGFFSFFAVVFGLVVSSIGVSFVIFGRMVLRYSAYIAFVVLALALVGFQFMYFADMRALDSIHEERVLQLEALLEEDRFDGPDVPGGVYEEECETCRYYGDGIVLFVPGESPLVVSLDLNRRVGPDGTFTHYYFLDALLPDGPLNDYQARPRSDSVVSTFGFLTTFSKTPAADGSVRERYDVSVGADESEIGFIIATTTGDFFTRNTESYLQFQSVGDTTVIIDGVEHDAFYLTETALSNDFTKRVFFDGFDEVVAHTHQFILWDENGDFYLIDDTDVSSGPAVYPSHSWLLYKEASTGLTKKGFRTDIAESADGWSVSVPDFRNGRIELTEVAVYKSDGDRRRSVVAGTVTDEQGTRTISGVLHHIED